MAKNWKRAHDGLAGEHETLKEHARALQGLVSDRGAALANATNRLSRAVTLLLGAAENMRANGLTASAQALGDAVADLTANHEGTNP